ncbi:MAG: hypothetical protein HN478_15395, partial [Rhodospirillaceae bacterium]|nr:hypothetical protein [Rhodospirillaceae bacterium]
MGDGARVRRLVTEWEFLVSTLQPPTSNPAEQLMDRVGVGIGVTVLAGFLG